MEETNVAAEVRAAIARKQASKVELAEKLGMTPSALSRRVNGHIKFNADEVAMVADVLNVTVASLYGEAAA